MKREIQIIHDWDYPYPSGTWAIKKGIKLFVYALSRKLHFLRRFCVDIYEEQLGVAKKYLLIEELCGIKPYYYIRPNVQEAFREFIAKIPNVGIHLHYKNKDRIWIPGVGGKRYWKYSAVCKTTQGGIFKLDSGKRKQSGVMNFHVISERDDLTPYLEFLKKQKNM